MRFLKNIIGIITLSILLQGMASAEDKDSVGGTEWGAGITFQQYILPDEDDLSVPVLSVYADSLLFEARYNYEDREAGSLWLGKSFEFGEDVAWELTPMAGAVIGAVHGAAPGLKADVTYRAFNLYSEMEYVFNFEGRDFNYFYSWSELTVGLLDWPRVGIVGNRTRAYSSSVEVDRGPIVRLEFKRVSFTCTMLNLDESPMTVLGVEAEF